MCGIAGIYPLKTSTKIPHEIIDCMLDKIEYRGPDARNKLCNEKISMGFNRLSIIDLVDGMQPLLSADRKILLVCNGEIFNYIELKKFLEKRGYTFRTQCDIEVLIPLYLEYGINFLDHINGQFSIALYDANLDKLILIRDPAGICPLFYARHNHNIVFSSEIKSLLEIPNFQSKADLVGLDQLLTFPSIISPRTMFCDVFSIPPGLAYIFNRKGDKHIHKYWDYNKIISENKYNNDDDYLAEFEESLNRAVKIRLRADVPVCAYLSGGLDSSLILALIKENSNPNNVIKTFSINFDEKIISEGKYQKMVSNHFETDHYSCLFNTSHIVKCLEDIVYHSETPLKETFNCASLTLSGMAKSKNIRVALAGQGADELFAGYVGFLFDAMLRNHSALYNESELQEKLWGSAGFVYEKKYHKYTDIKTSIYSDSIRQSYHQYNCLNYPIMDTDILRNRTDLLRRTLIDLRLRLADHLLSGHGDRMAMANSVEVRYPFLDPDIIKLAINMPDHLKLNNGVGKYILKKISRNRLPEVIINREKQGFAAHASPFLLRHSPEYINDLISYDAIKQQGIFDPDAVEKLKKQYANPNFVIKVPFDNDLLMPVITFSIWQRKFNCFTV